ncbi:hypothetical protein BJ742DRAFT_337421 [Cladochytrium replicatum]|nr:hypothetical protein BJ742DRAFT_337421 [Cladochytrium replicatum]
MKRMNIMDLCLTEHDVLPKTLARPGPRDSDVLHYSQVTRMIWQQHYFELLGTFSDAAECVPCMRTALVQFYTQAKIDSTSSDQNPIDPRLVRFLDLEQAHLKKLEFEWGTNVEPSKRATFRTLPTFQHLEEVVLYVKLGSTLQTIRKSGEFANALIEVANRMPRILFNINIHVGLLDDHDDQIYSRDDCPIDDHVLQVLSEGLASIPPESDTNGKQKRESFQLDSSEFKSIRLRAIDETNGPIVQARVRPMNISFTLKFHSRISGSYLAECRQVLQQCGVQSGLGIDLRDASFQMNDGLWTKCINIFEVLTSLNLSGCMLGGKCIQDLCSAILKSAKLVGCAIRELKLSENIAEGDSNCLDASKTLVDLLSCNTVPRGTLELLDISCNYFSAHGLDSIITTFAAPSSFVSRLRILDLSDTNIDPSMGNLGRVLGLGHLSSLESLKLSNNRLWPRALSIFVNEWRAHLDTRQTSAARKFRLKELELGQNLFDETIICDSPGTLRGNRSGSSTRHGCLALVLTSNMMDRLARLDLSGGEHGPYLGDNGCMQLLRILFHSSPNPNASREKQRSRLKYLNLSCQQVGDKTCEYLGRLFMVKTQTFWIDHLVLRANRATDDGVECMMRGAATVAGTDAALLFRKYCPGGDCDGPVRGMLFDLSNNLLSDDGIDRCRSFSINNTNGHIILVRR